ncbi:aldose 1-epimerase family protein [Cetobacterium somerae]|uniref:aldose 1-epimerase family protein n=1 Tax=Cetobacterium sp. NK01 TaxID=2993530 RepID=UPI00211694C6|nr:aldose 1-epimerase family protein [Cetobacterium sp. NK01]MCQ8211281.1 aldose 1-epimerase family protein [Cetobacterium sp. NK01]
MIKIENEKLVVLINKFGAELKSVVNKENNIEYIWPGTDGSFKKSAPNLFPFIGNILKGEIDYPLGKDERVSLPMTKHGFARDLDFETLEITKTTAKFQLKPNEYIKEKYPYNFSLIIEYILENDTLHHNYVVKNNGIVEMYYHIGGHTAFYCNYNGDSKFENYYLEFKEEKCSFYKIDETNNSFLSEISEELIVTEKFVLSKEKFSKDAIVIDGLKNNVVNLRHTKSNHGLEFKFENLPILTLWTSTDSSEFICLEPWAGITDFTNGSNRVEDKREIQKLNSNEQKKYSQIIRFY